MQRLTANKMPNFSKICQTPAIVIAGLVMSPKTEVFTIGNQTDKVYTFVQISNILKVIVLKMSSMCLNRIQARRRGP